MTLETLWGVGWQVEADKSPQADAGALDLPASEEGALIRVFHRSRVATGEAAPEVWLVWVREEEEEGGRQGVGEEVGSMLLRLEGMAEVRRVGPEVVGVSTGPKLATVWAEVEALESTRVGTVTDLNREPVYGAAATEVVAPSEPPQPRILPCYRRSTQVRAEAAGEEIGMVVAMGAREAAGLAERSGSSAPAQSG